MAGGERGDKNETEQTERPSRSGAVEKEVGGEHEQESQQEKSPRGI
jgi:hypothetical protein